MRIIKFFTVFLCFIVAILPTLSVNAAAQSVACSFEVENQVTGDTPSADESFTFKLEAVGEAPMPEKDTINVTGNHSETFPPITYTEPETYQYVIRQIAGNMDGYTYDNRVYNVTVQVTTDDEGLLSISQYVSQQGSNLKKDKIVFVNLYNTADISFNNSTTVTDSVQTGDNSEIEFWSLICSISFVLLFFIATLSCRNRKTHQ